MSDILSYKCPSCGAPLKYGADDGKFVCEYCDSTFNFDEVKDADVNQEKPYDWGEYNANISKDEIEGTRSYICKSCGAEILTDGVTAATHCPYCDNVVIVEPNLSGMIKPNGVIPFKINNKNLQDRVKEYCKGKLLLPNNFLSTHKIEQVQGVYVPFWLYDCHADGDMSFDGTRIRHWSDSRYNYTETSHYLVTCDGEMSFEKIPVDGSAAMDDALMDSIEPFHFEELQPFAPGFLSGFLANRFDQNADDCLPRADVRVKNSVAEMYRNALHGSFVTLTPMKSNIQLRDTSVNYVLLPVYLINASYAGQKYQFAVNGQTGKIIGDLPISKGKAFGYFMGIMAGVGAIATLLSYLTL